MLTKHESGICSVADSSACIAHLQTVRHHVVSAEASSTSSISGPASGIRAMNTQMDWPCILVHPSSTSVTSSGKHMAEIIATIIMTTSPYLPFSRVSRNCLEAATHRELWQGHACMNQAADSSRTCSKSCSQTSWAVAWTSLLKPPQEPGRVHQSEGKPVHDDGLQ